MTPGKRHGLRGSPGRAAAREHLASGFPIYVGDRLHPGRIVKVYPDGRWECIAVDDAGHVTVLGPAPEPSDKG